ncbi:MAG: zinc-ribbon domain-containing protein [Paludibacteraceae bacterium]|nr:zinc-ribbon domain-containing protein [Paludibacteraceae bacterium]MBO5345753.1 zinc-ribbon domain-containing protein [Paludibacteraceae bacterium]
MALKKCPECGYEISESALSCPKCGHTTNKAKIYFVSLFIMLFNIFLIITVIHLRLFS